ncbi:MAG: hypothetical protein ACUVWJ_05295 [Spirochaetota bacterium]
MLEIIIIVGTILAICGIAAIIIGFLPKKTAFIMAALGSILLGAGFFLKKHLKKSN